jgi:hypothetical protein
MFKNVNLVLQTTNLEQISLPRQRRPPARLTGNAVAFVAPNAMNHYRAIYFTLLDTTITQLQARFRQASMERCIGLEDALLNGCTNRDTDAYPELCSVYLAQELAMFRQAYQYTEAQIGRRLCFAIYRMNVSGSFRMSSKVFTCMGSGQPFILPGSINWYQPRLGFKCCFDCICDGIG